MPLVSEKQLGELLLLRERSPAEYSDKHSLNEVLDCFQVLECWQELLSDVASLNVKQNPSRSSIKLGNVDGDMEPTDSTP